MACIVSEAEGAEGAALFRHRVPASLRQDQPDRCVFVACKDPPVSWINSVPCNAFCSPFTSFLSSLEHSSPLSSPDLSRTSPPMTEVAMLIIMAGAYFLDEQTRLQSFGQASFRALRARRAGSTFGAKHLTFRDR